CYAPVVLYKNEFYTTAIRVDREKRQELKGMDCSKIERGVKKFKKVFPSNRLVRHLENCALRYGCPAAKNFFLQRYEAPLPTSPACNADCLGCISYQRGKKCSMTQPRIKFIPSAREIAEVAVHHIKSVKDPVVSFGQGCEGEPLLSGVEIEKAIKLIRRGTLKGMINMNTNASKPEVLKKLFRSGLDSIRVSINSVRKKYYDLYYSPRGYNFGDVVTSVKTAKNAGAFVSLNYLLVPGFTDLKNEADALFDFIHKNRVDMIQWRNLNYDPMDYFRKMKITPARGEMIGVDVLINSVHKEFPRLLKGYFNPSRRRVRRYYENTTR
ncbi:MAG: radical SAM protein, partial [Candidatus Omnitrophica bacterium]|nr:radical SAM protein [Candidatus Omnitrophota bacterium]